MNFKSRERRESIKIEGLKATGFLKIISRDSGKVTRTLY